MNIWITLTSSLISGLIGVLVSAAYYRKYENRKMKLDLLRRLAGARHQVAGAGAITGYDDFFTALNEVFVVFHDEPEVISAIETFRRELGRPQNIENNLPSLFKELFKALGLEQGYLNDSFILRSFTPGPSLQNQSK